MYRAVGVGAKPVEVNGKELRGGGGLRDARCLCPLCGSEVRTSGLRFAEGIVALGDEFVQLTRGEAIIFGALFRARPSAAYRERIYSAYVERWPLDNDWPDPKVIDVHISHLRKKLVRLGVRIETWRGEGFRLVEPNAAARLEAAE